MLLFREKIPADWLPKVLANLPEVLVDHAHLERKAATSALNLEKYRDLYRSRAGTERDCDRRTATFRSGSQFAEAARDSVRATVSEPVDHWNDAFNSQRQPPSSDRSFVVLRFDRRA